eukprot:243928-Pleurochrysis_carterae.AAC.3
MRWICQTLRISQDTNDISWMSRCCGCLRSFSHGSPPFRTATTRRPCEVNVESELRSAFARVYVRSIASAHTFNASPYQRPYCAHLASRKSR